MNRIQRRKFLQLSAVGAGALALGMAGCAPEPTPTPSPTAVPPTAVPPTAVPPTSVPAAAVAGATAAPTNTVVPVSTLSSDIGQATVRFMESLDNARLDKATYDFADNERFRWHWTTPSGFPRNGLALNEMEAAQKEAAFALLAASLSPAGFAKAQEIMSLQTQLGNNPELYYVTVFGEPGGAGPWGWRWEGHHLSRHFTVAGDEVSMTPFFHGSWPTETEQGLRAMAIEEDNALQLINSLQGEALAEATIQERTLTQHVTWNEAQVAPLEHVGIPYSKLDATQQALVGGIVNAYLESLPPDIAAQNMERVQSGLERIRFGWAGSLERKRPQYYRLQGDKFLLEFDNSRNGGTHVHSVWRDFERDFGYHIV